MVANRKTIDQIIKILLKYVDHKTARRLARDLYNHVEGNQSITDTFYRIVGKLEEEEDA